MYIHIRIYIHIHIYMYMHTPTFKHTSNHIVSNQWCSSHRHSHHPMALSPAGPNTTQELKQHSARLEYLYFGINSVFFVGVIHWLFLYQKACLWLEVGYAMLASMCHNKGIKAFRYRPKFHLGMHIVEDLTLGSQGFNPCSASCWGDEDFIGRCSRISRTCHPLLAATRAIQKMLGLYYQQFSRMGFK